MLNKRLIISEFFIHTSKVGVVILVVRPWEVIRASVSMFINILGIRIKSYGHVLGPPRFLFNSEKIIFSHKIRPFFNGLIKKFVKGIKDCLEFVFGMGMLIFTLRASFLL